MFYICSIKDGCQPRSADIAKINAPAIEIADALSVGARYVILMTSLPSAAGRQPTADEIQQLVRLRKALRLHLVPDRAAAILPLGERHAGDDVHVLDLDRGLWKVCYVERGSEQSGSACFFESASNATSYLFWQLASGRSPLTFQLADCDPKPY
jgi:hypothetical protein